MVSLKKENTTAAKKLAKAGRYMGAVVLSRFKKLDASTGGVGKASLMQLKTARRTDQRSTFSIADSSRAVSHSTGSHTALTRGGDTAASSLDSTRRSPAAAAGGARRLLTRKSASDSGGRVNSGLGDFARINSGANMSICGDAESPTKGSMADETAAINSSRQARTGRRSYGKYRARRTDQRSTFSIAESSRAASRSTGSHTALTRGGDTAASPIDSTGPSPAAAAGGARRLLTRKLASGSGRRVNSGLGDFARINSGANNSICGGAESPTKGSMADETAAIDSSRQALAGGRSYGKFRGKTVSIAASRGCQSPSSRMFMASNSEEIPSRESKPKDGLTPSQIKEQKIFGECNFLPLDTFYKKAVITPKQERQFLAAPKWSRVYGTRFLYDIAWQNWRHHQDVNVDFTRESLRRSCPNYLRPSNFRHNY